MNDDEHPNDTVLTRELRGALSGVAAPERPQLAAITSRGRAHQHRRRAGLAGLGVAGVGAGTALALSLTGVLGAAPARSTGTIRTAAPAPSTGTIRTAAFTLTSNANGTDTLTLKLSQMFDPAALQQAFAHDGIPALVRTGTYCLSNPPAPAPDSSGVLTYEYPNGTPLPRPGNPAPPPASPGPIADFLAVINPAKLPSGTELFFGYLGRGLLFTDLIDTSSYTCSNQLPTAP